MSVGVGRVDMLAPSMDFLAPFFALASVLELRITHITISTFLYFCMLLIRFPIFGFVRLNMANGTVLIGSSFAAVQTTIAAAESSASLAALSSSLPPSTSTLSASLSTSALSASSSASTSASSVLFVIESLRVECRSADSFELAAVVDGALAWKVRRCCLLMNQNQNVYSPKEFSLKSVHRRE
jgi:hypothetical protein